MKQPSIIFRIQRFLSFILKGIGKRETEHFLFLLPKPMQDTELYQTLADYGWQPNNYGYSYKGQLYQCRRLVNRGKHQYHLRFYEDGTVSGHFEIAVEFDTSDHLSGVDLRTMTEPEVNELKKQIGVGCE